MFKSSILSGILIGLAGWINIAVGGSIMGAILFSVGLMAVCIYSSYLYTGKAGSWKIEYFSLWRDLGGLGKILAGNVVGTFLISLILPETSVYLSQIIEYRLSSGYLESFSRGIGCGILMEIAVYSWREYKTLIPILFCVPAFILSGMYHSIADSFYYFAAPKYLDFHVLGIWIMTVLGNFVGCNVRRLLT